MTTICINTDSLCQEILARSALLRAEGAPCGRLLTAADSAALRIVLASRFVSLCGRMGAEVSESATLLSATLSLRSGMSAALARALAERAVVGRVLSEFIPEAAPDISDTECAERALLDGRATDISPKVAKTPHPY